MSENIPIRNSSRSIEQKRFSIQIIQTGSTPMHAPYKQLTKQFEEKEKTTSILSKEPQKEQIISFQGNCQIQKTNIVLDKWKEIKSQYSSLIKKRNISEKILINQLDTLPNLNISKKKSFPYSVDPFERKISKKFADTNSQFFKKSTTMASKAVHPENNGEDTYAADDPGLELAYLLLDRGRFLFNPEGIFKKIWNLVLIILLIYTATIMPYKLAFIESDVEVWFWLDMFIDCLFMSDVLVNLNTPYSDSEGNYVYSRKKICLNYLKGWMIVDIVASIPMGAVERIVIGSSSDVGDYNQLLRLARLPRLYRLIRIIRLFKMVKVFKKSLIIEGVQDFLRLNTAVVRLISFILTVFTCVHLVGCLWYLISKFDDFSPDTWVTRTHLQDDDNYSLYVTSVYWAFQTLLTVGYGDITAVTTSEATVAICWMVFGAGVFSFTVGNLSSVLANLDLRSSDLALKMAKLNEFCKEAQIGKNLKDKLRKAINYSAKKNLLSWNDKQKIFNELPPYLKSEVAIKMYSGVINNIHFFKHKDSTFLALVVPMLQPLKTGPKEFLYKQGDHPNGLFFLTEGRVSFLIGNNIPIKSMVRGSYFGEYEILYKKRRSTSVRCDILSHFLTLSKNVNQMSWIFESTILQEYPEVISEMLRVSKERERRFNEAKYQVLQFIKQRKQSLLPEQNPQNKLTVSNIKKLLANIKKQESINNQDESNNQTQNNNIQNNEKNEVSSKIQSNSIRVSNTIPKLPKPVLPEEEEAKTLPILITNPKIVKRMSKFKVNAQPFPPKENDSPKKDDDMKKQKGILEKTTLLEGETPETTVNETKQPISPNTQNPPRLKSQLLSKILINPPKSQNEEKESNHPGISLFEFALPPLEKPKNQISLTDFTPKEEIKNDIKDIKSESKVEEINTPQLPTKNFKEEDKEEKKESNEKFGSKNVLYPQMLKEMETRPRHDLKVEDLETVYLNTSYKENSKNECSKSNRFIEQEQINQKKVFNKAVYKKGKIIPQNFENTKVPDMKLKTEKKLDKIENEINQMHSMIQKIQISPKNNTTSPIKSENETSLSKSNIWSDHSNTRNLRKEDEYSLYKKTFAKNEAEIESFSEASSWNSDEDMTPYGTQIPPKGEIINKNSQMNEKEMLRQLTQIKGTIDKTSARQKKFEKKLDTIQDQVSQMIHLMNTTLGFKSANTIHNMEFPLSILDAHPDFIRVKTLTNLASPKNEERGRIAPEKRESEVQMFSNPQDY